MKFDYDEDEVVAPSPEEVRLEMESQRMFAERAKFQLEVEFAWAAIIERFHFKTVKRDSQGNDKFSCVLLSPQCLIKIMKSPGGTAIFFGSVSIPDSEYLYSDAPGPLWTNWNDLKGFLQHKYPDQPLDLPRLPTGSENAMEELMAAHGGRRPAQWWAEYERFQAGCNDGKCPKCGYELRGNSGRCPGCRTGVSGPTNAEILAWFAEPPPRRVQIKGIALANKVLWFVFGLLGMFGFLLLGLLLLGVFGTPPAPCSSPLGAIACLIGAILFFGSSVRGNGHRNMLSSGTAVIGQVTAKNYSVEGGGELRHTHYWIGYKFQRQGVQRDVYCEVYSGGLYEQLVVGQDIVIVIGPGEGESYELFDVMGYEPYQPEPPPQKRERWCSLKCQVFALVRRLLKWLRIG